jgi:hypothetical protein
MKFSPPKKQKVQFSACFPFQYICLEPNRGFINNLRLKNDNELVQFALNKTTIY